MSENKSDTIKQIAFRFLASIFMGCAAGGGLGWLEGFFTAPVEKSAAGFLCVGFAGTLGLCSSALVVLAAFLFWGKAPLTHLKKKVAVVKNDPQVAYSLLATSLLLQGSILIWAVVAFNGIKLSLGAFAHMGLAALLLVIALLGTAAFLFFVSLVAKRFLVVLAQKVVPEKWSPVVALASFAVLPLIASALYGISPEDGNGVVYFLGLLKRDELKLSFLGLAAIPALVSLGIFAFTPSKVHKWLLPSGTLAGGMVIGALAVAGLGFNDTAEAAAHVESNTPLCAKLVSVARKVCDADKDGSARYFGGGDCNDQDPNIWPGAIDIVGNGIDEDCSMGDAVPIAAPAEPAKPLNEQQQQQVAQAVAQLDDLSLLVLSVDALRWDLGFRGYHRDISPNIDSLAAKGIVFENAYALSSFTGRCIAPWLVGRYPTETFCTQAHLPKYFDKNEFLTERLKEEGFATGAVHGHPYFKRSGMEQGFDRFEVIVPPGDKHIDQKITSPQIADSLVSMLKDETFTKGRFFIWGHFMDPHKQYLEHKGFSKYGRGSRARYDGEVAFTDYHLGRVLAALKETGLDKRTIVMVTGDHGEAFGEHDINFHGRRLWEEVVKVPWIWVIPGMEKRNVAARVSHLDFASTVYDLLKTKPSEQAKGQSLVPLMTGVETESRLIYLDQPLGAYIPEMYGVIKDDYKLIHQIDGNRYKLFNLKEDPEEKQDLARTDKEQLGRLKQVYQGFRGSLSVNINVYKK